MSDEELIEPYDNLLWPAWVPVEEGEMELGTRVVIFKADRGTEDMMLKKADSLRRNLSRYVKNKYPRELWVIGDRKSPDPLGGYEVYAEYHGVATTSAVRGQWKARRRRKNQAKPTP